MKKRQLNRMIIILLVITCCVSCDQLSKEVVRNSITEYDRIEVISNYLILTKIENTGAFMGLGSTLPEYIRIILFIVLPVIVCLLGVVYIMVKKQLPLGIWLGWALILGGGIGNLYDRIVYESVTDFLYLSVGWFRTGIFNIADITILIGMFVFLLFNRQYLVSNKKMTDYEHQ